MSKNSGTSKSSKAVGLGGAKAPTGLAKGAKAITKAVSKGKAPPTGFQGATPKTTGKMKPSTPVIGATRGQGANFATINKDRMKGTIKQLGM
jgi:hypothetical protein